MESKSDKIISGDILTKSEGCAVSVIFSDSLGEAISLAVWFGNDEDGWIRDTEQGIGLSLHGFDRLVDLVTSHRRKS